MDFRFSHFVAVIVIMKYGLFSYNITWNHDASRVAYILEKDNLQLVCVDFWYMELFCVVKNG